VIKEEVSFVAWRFYITLFLIILAMLGLGWRIFNLTILHQSFLRYQGNERILRLMNTPAIRGMIVDRYGFPLAVSTSVYSIWINPSLFLPTKKALSALAPLLNLTNKELSIMIRKRKNGHQFMYLKRGLAPDIAARIKLLNLPGLYTQEEYRRYYPEGEVTAHVLGFTNVDDQGQEGLELIYNQWLSGESGKKWVAKDRLGRVISDVRSVQKQKPGRDLVLSIDRRIQYLAYRELLAGVTQHHAASGSAVVLDIKTGEILAMVNFPSFNPNNRAHVSRYNIRNRAVTDTFEPGSTIKTFTIASALSGGYIRPDTIIDTSPGWMRVDRHIVRDEHHNNGSLTIAQILQRSSNMGAAKIVLSMPPDQLWTLLHEVGFGEITGVGFPGEQSGSLVKHHPWGAFTLATLSFGYGMSVNALQLTRAYAVIANEGIKLPVSLLRLDKLPVGEQVIDKKSAGYMLGLLESVVTKGGTGELAQVPGYRVAGKTGTAKMAKAHGYEEHRYISSFVGMAPLNDPRFVVTVVMYDPQGKQYLGGSVSGPVFEKIMEGTLRIAAIPPDVVVTDVKLG
jgi:cell division protein FtsI (penicillin-binding protein 3)